MNTRLIHFGLSCLLLFIQLIAWAEQIAPPSRFISHMVDPQKDELAFFWRDEAGEPYQHFQR